MSILADFNPKFLPFSLSGMREERAVTYIETGSCEGKSLVNAIDAGIQELHGIELCWRHIVTCGEKLTRDRGFRATAENTDLPIHQRIFLERPHQRVTLHCVSSVRGGLQHAIDPSKRTVLYLDAHFSGGEGDVWEPCDGQCPLLEEIRIILSYDWAVPPVLVIDDAFQMGCSDSWWSTYFVGGPFDRKQWPNVGQICDLLRGFTMVMHAGILYFWKE